MTDDTPKLVEAFLSGGSVDEIFRKEIEKAVNTLLETEITAFLGYVPLQRGKRALLLKDPSRLWPVQMCH